MQRIVQTRVCAIFTYLPNFVGVEYFRHADQVSVIYTKTYVDGANLYIQYVYLFICVYGERVVLREDTCEY
jgi:hypothetical protein